jgi:hypothetical protein
MEQPGMDINERVARLEDAVGWLWQLATENVDPDAKPNVNAILQNASLSMKRTVEAINAERALPA